MPTPPPPPPPPPPPHPLRACCCVCFEHYACIYCRQPTSHWASATKAHCCPALNAGAAHPLQCDHAVSSPSRNICNAGKCRDLSSPAENVPEALLPAAGTFERNVMDALRARAAAQAGAQPAAPAPTEAPVAAAAAAAGPPASEGPAAALAALAALGRDGLPPQEDVPMQVYLYFKTNWACLHYSGVFAWQHFVSTKDWHRNVLDSCIYCHRRDKVRCPPPPPPPSFRCTVACSMPVRIHAEHHACTHGILPADLAFIWVICGQHKDPVEAMVVRLEWR